MQINKINKLPGKHVCYVLEFRKLEKRGNQLINTVKNIGILRLLHLALPAASVFYFQIYYSVQYLLCSAGFLLIFDQYFITFGCI